MTKDNNHKIKEKKKDNDKISKEDIKTIQDSLEKTAKHDIKEYKKHQKKLEAEEKRKKKLEEQNKKEKEELENLKLPTEEEKKTEKGKTKKKIKLVIFTILVLIGLFFWSRFVSTSGLVVKEYAIKTNELSSAYDGFKIVHFSDIHYGTLVHGGELEHLVETINKQSPDIVVFTGDLIDSSIVLSEKEINYISGVLAGINPKIETIAVIGNNDHTHDYFVKITNNLDWIILNNKYEYVYNNDTTPLIFVGFDDLTSGKPDYNNAFSFLNEVEQSYTILLMHEPDQVDQIGDYKYNLVLAGHSMLGAVRVPFLGALYKPKGARKYVDEKYNLEDAEMYISGGVGTSTFKHRFLNKPSINLYRFYTE